MLAHCLQRRAKTEPTLSQRLVSAAILDKCFKNVTPSTIARGHNAFPEMFLYRAEVFIQAFKEMK